MIRRNAVMHRVCYNTTLAGGEAACLALLHSEELAVRSLQQLHAQVLQRRSQLGMKSIFKDTVFK